MKVDFDVCLSFRTAFHNLVFKFGVIFDIFYYFQLFFSYWLIQLLLISEAKYLMKTKTKNKNEVVCAQILVAVLYTPLGNIRTLL